MQASVAENIELVKIRATEQVAILFIDKDSWRFVWFVGKNNPWFVGKNLKFVGKKSEIRGP